MSFRKSSSNRNGSKSDVLPNPKARRKCTPAPSIVGLDLLSRLIGRIDIAPPVYECHDGMDETVLTAASPALLYTARTRRCKSESLSELHSIGPWQETISWSKSTPAG